jgi:hypothetical protein
MEPACSLLCSKEPITGPYSEQILTSYFFKIHFNIITYLYLHPISSLFPSGLSIKALDLFLSCVCYMSAHLILLHVIIPQHLLNFISTVWIFLLSRFVKVQLGGQ